MNDFKLTVGMEPTDKYEKAKQDLLDAIESFGKLDDLQKRQLILELCGHDRATTFFNLVQQSGR